MGNENSLEEDSPNKKSVLKNANLEGVVIISSTKRCEEDKGVVEFVSDLWNKGYRSQRKKSYNIHYTTYFDPVKKKIISEISKRCESGDGQVKKLTYFNHNNFPYLLSLYTKVLEFGGTRKVLKTTNLMSSISSESKQHKILSDSSIYFGKIPNEQIIICSSYWNRRLGYLNMENGEMVMEDDIGSIIDNVQKRFKGKRRKLLFIHSIEVLDSTRVVISLNADNVNGVGSLIMWDMKRHEPSFILQDDIGDLYFDEMLYCKEKEIVIGGRGDVCRKKFVIIDSKTLKIITTCDVGFYIIVVFCLLEGDNELVCGELHEDNLTGSISFWDLETYELKKRFKIPKCASKISLKCTSVILKIINIPRINSILISTQERFIMFDMKTEKFIFSSRKKEEISDFRPIRQGFINSVVYIPCVEDRLKKKNTIAINDQNERSKFMKECISESSYNCGGELIFLFKIKLENKTIFSIKL